LLSNLRPDHPRRMVCRRFIIMVGEYRWKLLIKFDHCRNWHLSPFCSRDLDLDSMTFICEPDLYTLEVQKWTSYVKAFKSYRLTDIHTRPKYTLCFKKMWCRIFAITSSTVNRFWKFFHCWQQWWIICKINTTFFAAS